jgi:hypothetical protein
MAKKDFININAPIESVGGLHLSDTIDVNAPVPSLQALPQNAVVHGLALGQLGLKVGVSGFSVGNYGVYASSEQSIGLFATGTELAAEFDGSVLIHGNLDLRGTTSVSGDLHTRGNHIVDGDIQLAGADYAEDFDVVDAVAAAPGTVMVLDDDGFLRESASAYDRRVAGVVSGAGRYQPAVILDRQPQATGARRPLALMGKVYCKVDATAAPVAVGDLLTTSPTPGHAMKAGDPAQAFGAVIGKALRPLSEGTGLVPILVALQ